MRFVVMGGSLRKDSLNLRLLNHLARTLEAKGHEVVRIHGEDLRLPLYDGDLSEPPAKVTEIQKAMLESQGLVIVSPEYNAGIPGHLKNVVDWLSTVSPSPWPELPVLLAAASPGAFGGSRGMVTWRATLANMGAFVIPEALPVPMADKNLDADGTPLEARTLESIPKVLDKFIGLAGRLRAHTSQPA